MMRRPILSDLTAIVVGNAERTKTVGGAGVHRDLRGEVDEVSVHTCC